MLLGPAQCSLYVQARDALLSLKHTKRHGHWLRYSSESIPLKPEAPMVVSVKCCGLWFTNPCRVVDVSQRKQWFGLWGPQSTDVVWRTLQGHMLQGEERMRVTYQPRKQPHDNGEQRW